MNASWHPDCFHCQLCDAPLADTGFVRNMGRYVCLWSSLVAMAMQEVDSSMCYYSVERCVENAMLKRKLQELGNMSAINASKLNQSS